MKAVHRYTTWAPKEIKAERTITCAPTFKMTKQGRRQVIITQVDAYCAPPSACTVRKGNPPRTSGGRLAAQNGHHHLADTGQTCIVGSA